MEVHDFVVEKDKEILKWNEIITFLNSVILTDDTIGRKYSTMWGKSQRLTRENLCFFRCKVGSWNRVVWKQGTSQFTRSYFLVVVCVVVWDIYQRLRCLLMALLGVIGQWRLTLKVTSCPLLFSHLFASVSPWSKPLCTPDLKATEPGQKPLNSGAKIDFPSS